MTLREGLMETRCEDPLVVHRMVTPPWREDAGRVVIVFECPDPACAGRFADHSDWLPCRWSWPYAHGKVYNGEAFPKRRCTNCSHIRRAGQPQAEIRAG